MHRDLTARRVEREVFRLEACWADQLGRWWSWRPYWARCPLRSRWARTAGWSGHTRGA